jgi:hypothetical protein
MNKLENTLDNILLKLDRIIVLLEKSQEENKISLNSHFDALNMLDAIGTDIPFPTPWNSDSIPTCKDDILMRRDK